MKLGRMILAVAALAVAGCGKTGDGDPAKEAAVTVNGKTLTFAELNDDAAKMVAAQKGIPPEQAEQAKSYFTEQLAQQFVVETLFAEEAAKKGLKVTDEDRKKFEADLAKNDQPDAPKTIAALAEKLPFGKERSLKKIEAQLLIQKFMETEFASKATIDPKDVERELKRAADSAEKVRASHILVKTEGADAEKAKKAEATIKDLKKQLDGLKGDALKDKFAELAKAHSDCPSKSRGGDLSLFSKGQMVKEFEEVAFKSEPFVVSDPVKTKFGWHLIMVTEKPAPKAPPAKADIERNLRMRAAQGDLRKCFERLRKSAKIVAPTFPSINTPKAPAAKSAPAAKVESEPVEVKPAAKPADKPAPAKK